MIIEESDFRMESCSESNYRFDLELLKTIKPRGGQPRDELKNVGYAMTFEKCLQCIVNNRIERKKDTLTLVEYIKEYNRISEELKSTLKL